MEIIIFFTKPDRLVDIGVIFPWDYDIDLILKSSFDNNNEIWVVWDEIEFDFIKQSLDGIEHIESLNFVYHTKPVEGFLLNFRNYLLERRIRFESIKSNQIPNLNCLYEELKDVFPNQLTQQHFMAINERIIPCSKYKSRIMTKFDDKEAILNNGIEMNKFPKNVQTIYFEAIKGITFDNFEEKKTELSKALDEYCKFITNQLLHNE